VLLLASYSAISVVQHRRLHTRRLREARIVSALHLLGAEVQEHIVEEFVPFGRVLPGRSGARYAYAIKSRNPAVTDRDLAVLDQFDADRVFYLDVVNCRVGDATLARAGRFEKLILLGMGPSRNNSKEPWPSGPTGLMTDAGFVHLERMPYLETVGLHGPDVTDRALAHLAGARKLRVLILYGSRVTAAGLTALGPKPALVTLKLGGTHFDDDDLAALAQFPSLETLDLRETAVTDAGLPRFKALTHLKVLILAGCAVSDEAVDELIKSRPGLVVDYAESRVTTAAKR
jgi:hypothetical protein